ncbi:MAG: hypothetical protein ABL879_00770 [Devosia sp.]
MDKVDAQREVLRRWQALPASGRQTFEQATGFAEAQANLLDFRTMGEKTKVITAWLIREIEREKQAGAPEPVPDSASFESAKPTSAMEADKKEAEDADTIVEVVTAEEIVPEIESDTDPVLTEVADEDAEEKNSKAVNPSEDLVETPEVLEPLVAAEVGPESIEAVEMSEVELTDDFVDKAAIADLARLDGVDLAEPEGDVESLVSDAAEAKLEPPALTENDYDAESEADDDMALSVEDTTWTETKQAPRPTGTA